MVKKFIRQVEFYFNDLDQVGLQIGDGDRHDLSSEVLPKIDVSCLAKKVGRTTKLQKPEEVIEQLDSKTIDASPIEHDTTLEEFETFFNQSTKEIVFGCAFAL
ncbi:hypothetical protein Tco_0645654 [Tanacetum coccineum]